MEKQSKLIDGRFHAGEVTSGLGDDILLLKESGIIPKLAIIMLGNNPTSQVYVTNKLKKAKELGLQAELIKFARDVSEDKVIESIRALNENSSIHGIIVQLPLPGQISVPKIQESI